MKYSGNAMYLDCARTPITSAYRSATMLMFAAFGFGALLICKHTHTDRQTYKHAHIQTDKRAHRDTHTQKQIYACSAHSDEQRPPQKGPENAGQQCDIFWPVRAFIAC